jgi:predicted HAD superfamily Cof-like phosphohydrolase
MASKDDVKVRIGGDNRPLKTALTDSRGLISMFARTGSSALAPFTRALGGMVSSIFSVRGAIASLAGTGGLGLLINRSIETADAIAKTADRVGIGIEALQEYRHAAMLSGVTNEELSKAFSQLNRNASQAANGLQTYQRAFDMAGVSLRDHEGRLKSNEQLFEELAEAISKTTDATTRSDIAMTLFGRAGSRLLPLFKSGAEGLRQMRQEARDMGLVLDEVMVRDAEQAGDELDRVGSIIRTNLTRAVLTLTPQIISMAQGFSQWLVPALQDLQRWLPPAYLAADELRARMQGLRLDIETLAGLPLEDFLKLPDPKSVIPPELREGVAKLLAEYQDLGDKLLVRERQEAMLAATLENVAAPANATLATKIQEVRDALQFELDQLGRSAEEQRLWSEAKKAGIEDIEAFRVAIAPLIAEHERLTAAQQAGANAIKAWQQQQAEAKSIFEATRTPLEIYQAQIEKLNALLEAGSIRQETYNRAVVQAQDAFDQATEKTKKLESAQSSLAGVVKDVSGEALRGNMTTLQQWGDFALRQIGRVLDAWIELALTQSSTGGGAGGGLLGSILGGIASLFTGGAGAPPGSGPSGVGVGAGSLLPPRAMGGPVMPGVAYEVNERGKKELFVPSVAGYVLNAEASRAPAGALGGGGTTVHIYNNTGAEVRSRERTTPGGGRSVDVWLDESTARNIRRGGDTAEAILAITGARTRPVGR